MFSSIIYGRKVLKLQKWCSLRVVVNPLQNAFPFSSSAQDGRKGKDFNSLGLFTNLAESISKKVEDKGNAESVLSLLKSHGFTISSVITGYPQLLRLDAEESVLSRLKNNRRNQISSVITGHPQLLRLDAEKSVLPGLRNLLSRGASSSELDETLWKVPKISDFLEIDSDFFKEILEADKSCDDENILRNESALRDLGMPERLVFSLRFSCRHVKFETSLKKVVELGFDPTKSSFAQALRIVGGLKEETIEEKVNVYKKLGLTVEDIWSMFKKYPESLTYSEKKITQQFETFKKCGLFEEEILSLFKKFPDCICVSEHKVMKTTETFQGLGFSRDEFAIIVKQYPMCLTISVEFIKKKIEFVVKKMKWPLQAVVSNPKVLGYSLEKRIITRCNVIKALMAKGLIGDQLPPLRSVCYCTDQKFLKRFVQKHDDKELVAELMAIFNGKKSKTDDNS